MARGNRRKISLSAGGVAVVLDVNPADIEFRQAQASKNYDLAGGEYIVMGERKLCTFSLSTFLPVVGSRFNTTGRAPQEVRDILLGWMRGKTVVYVQVPEYYLGNAYITELSTVAQERDADMEVAVSLTQCRSLTDAGEQPGTPVAPGEDGDAIGSATTTAKYAMNLRNGPSSVYYDVVGTLKTGVTVPVYEQSGSWYKIRQDGQFYWAHDSLLTVTLYAENAKVGVRGAVQPPSTHTLLAGDTLWDMAKRYYGDGSRWQEIAAANDIGDPAQLGTAKCPVGRVLTIP